MEMELEGLSAVGICVMDPRNLNLRPGILCADEKGGGTGSQKLEVLFPVAGGSIGDN